MRGNSRGRLSCNLPCPVVARLRVTDINEAAIGDRDSDPSELVLQLGCAKATALLPRLRIEATEGTVGSRLLLTGDQGG